MGFLKPKYPKSDTPPPESSEARSFTRYSQPVDSPTWNRMTPYEQAAHLARLDGREREARMWERRARQAGEL